MPECVHRARLPSSDTGGMAEDSFRKTVAIALVAPLAALGGVYLGGLKATDTVRLQLRHAGEQTIRDERKSTYVSIIAAVNRSQDDAWSLTLARLGTDQTATAAAREKFVASQRAFREFTPSLMLFASFDAQVSSSNLLAATNELLDLTDRVPPPSYEEVAAAREKVGMALGAFVVQARKELGTDR